MTLALFAEFTARDGCEVRLRELVLELAARVRAEPGNLVFDPRTRSGEPGRWFVYEVYVDASAFESHRASGHSIRFNRRLADLIVEPTSALTLLDHAG